MEETQVAGDPWRMRRAFVFEKIMMIPVWIGVCVLLVETQSWRNCNERYKNNNIIRYTEDTEAHLFHSDTRGLSEALLFRHDYRRARLLSLLLCFLSSP